MILRIKPLAFLLYAISATILILGGVITFLLLQPADVLADWHISVKGDTHYPGEVIAVDSHYKKLKDVTGTAYRYIDCLNTRGTYTRYAVSSAPANNQAGLARSTGIFIVIPNEISVPTTCHISILIVYKINPLREQPEFTSGSEFKLRPKPMAHVSDPVVNSTVTVPQQVTITQAPATVPPSTVTSNTTTTNSTTNSVPAAQQSCTVNLLGLHLLCN